MTPLLHRLRLFAALFALGTAAGLLAADDEKPADLKELAKLIDQLGDDDPDVRKAAEEKIRDVGESALEPLRAATKDHPDADVKLRAIVLIQRIKKGAFGEKRQFVGHAFTKADHSEDPGIRHVAVSPDGKRALTGGGDQTVRLWDLETGKELKKMTGHGGWVWNVAFSPDGKEALSSGSLDKTLRRWDLESGKELLKIDTGLAQRAYGAAYSKDGKHVFVGGAGNDEKLEKDYTIRQFEADTGKEVKKFVGHEGWVWRLSMSPDGTRLASAGCTDFSFRIWDVETGKAVVVVNEAHGADNYVVGVAFSPDGKQVLTSGRDGTVRLWDAADGKPVMTYKGLSGNAEAIAWSKDGKRFLASDENRVHVFEKDSGKIIHRFEDHTADVLGVAFLPDGRSAVSVGKDNVMRLWGVPR